MKAKISSKIKSMFPNVSDETQLFMSNTISFLIRKFGTFYDEWMGSLQMLAQNYDIWLLTANQIREEGLLITNRFDQEVINPLIDINLKFQKQIQNLMSQFGLTAYSQGKLKNSEDEDTNILEELLLDD